MNVSNGFIGFTGRIGQESYRSKFVAMMIVNVAAMLLFPADNFTSDFGNLMSFLLLVSSLSLISLVARRLRDIGKSAWWVALIAPCVLVLYIVGIKFCFEPSKFPEQAGV